MNDSSITTYIALAYIASIIISCFIARRIYKRKGYSGIPLWSFQYIIFPPVFIAYACYSRVSTSPTEEYKNVRSHILKNEKDSYISSIVKFYESESEHEENNLCSKCVYFKPKYSICSKLKANVCKSVESCEKFKQNGV